jgi:hypothetical protein
VTGLISTCGQQFQDWSAAYRLFSQRRISTENLFAGVRRTICEMLPPEAPLCLAVDDSLLRKTGRKIHGVGWRRDPLGPKFQVNFVRAQRILQVSAAVPAAEHPQAVRMVPVDFLHAPIPTRPPNKAPVEQHRAYRRAARAAAIGHHAIDRLCSIRRSLPCAEDGSVRAMRLLVDGHYTNQTVLRRLPAQTTLIGRIRKDAKLCFPATDEQRRHRGRTLRYGSPAPTPEQLRTEQTAPWETITVLAAGTLHTCRVKTLTGLLWRAAGADQKLKLVVIAPLHYRLRQGSKFLYRQPASLICTDDGLDTQQIVQNYVWRWDIEVNFRDEKTLLGVGQAQVRTMASTQQLPAMLIAAYSILHLAAMRWRQTSDTADLLPPPKWSARRQPLRASTQRLIHRLQAEVWGRGLGLPLDHFSDFSSCRSKNQKPEKLLPSLADALLYSNR